MFIIESTTNTIISSWLHKANTLLHDRHIPSSRLDSELLLAYTLTVDRTWLRAHADELLQRQSLQYADKLLKRRLAREPIAYIIGSKEFYGRDFIVTRDVLIPRPESETMVELLKTLPIPEEACVIDVGTGSGCLGVTTKLELPKLDVTLSDISPEALAVARKNAMDLHANVQVVQDDLLLKSWTSSRRFDVIMANLPYVDRSWERSPETDHEPALALFANDGGLELIYALIEQTVPVLAHNGYVLLEADPEQHERIIAHGQKNGLRMETVRDYIVVLRRS